MLNQLIGALASIDRLAAFKRNPLLGFILPLSAKSNATHYMAMVQREAKWNDGRMLPRNVVEEEELVGVAGGVNITKAHMDYLNEINKKAKRQTIKKDAAITSYHEKLG